MEKEQLLHNGLTGLLRYEDRFDLVPPEHARWIGERLAWHKLLPMAAALNNGNPNTSEALGAIFRKTLLHNMIKEKTYYSQTCLIFKALDDAAIAYLPFKGPFWLGRLYEAYHWRHIGDLDLLLARDDVPGAAAVLSRMGYKAHYLEGSLTREMALRGELALFPDHRRPKDVPVELHWDLMPSPRFLKKQFLSVEDFTTRADGGCWRDISYCLPRPEIRFFYYVLHATCQHQFARFAHVATLVHFMQRHPDLDWDWLLELTLARRAGAPVYYGLRLAGFFHPLPRGAERLVSRLKPAWWTRLAAGFLPARHIVKAAPGNGAHRRKLFRAAMSWS